MFAVKLDEHQMGPLQMAWFPMQADVMGATGSWVKAEGYEPSEKGVLVYFTAPDLNAALGRAKERAVWSSRRKPASANTVSSV